jgi:probable F420-dependent oxidoreductase
VSDRPRLTVGLPIAGQITGEDHRGLVEIAQLADGLGVDALTTSDHVVMGEHLEQYRWGPFPFGKGVPWIEPLTLLSAIAGATADIRLVTGVLIAPLRPPALLAKIVATLDQLSRGRLDLGVGTGWQSAEYDALGLDFAQRAQMLDDTVAACRALWGPSPTTFTSATISFESIWCDPKPYRTGGPPVFFSGPLTPRNVRRIVTWGDGWVPIMGASLDEAERGIELLRRALADAGRDPAALLVRMPVPMARDDRGALDLERMASTAVGMRTIGITDATVSFALLADDRASAERRLDELVDRWKS